MDKRLLSFDPITGLSEYHSYDDQTDTTIIETVGDCQPYIEMNKLRQNDPDVWKAGVKQEFVLYASIPPAFQVKLLIEKGIDVYNKDHGPRLTRVLEDPEYRFLKCTTKKHQLK